MASGGSVEIEVEGQLRLHNNGDSMIALVVGYKNDGEMKE